MKKISAEWLFFTVAGAVVATIAVDIFRKHKAQKLALENKAATPKEILIIDKL